MKLCSHPQVVPVLSSPRLQRLAGVGLVPAIPPSNDHLLGVPVFKTWLGMILANTWVLSLCALGCGGAVLTVGVRGRGRG